MGRRPTSEGDGIKRIARNRKAFHDFEILEKLEAGLVLTGTEVKSLRQGTVSLDEAHARPRNEEVFLLGVHIPPYLPGTWTNHEPERSRKLLLHRREIRKLIEKVTVERLTIVPLELYWKNGFAKVLLGVARGKKRHDKRHAIRSREEARAIERSLGRRGGEGDP
jgi:SsrA-binding protein